MPKNQDFEDLVKIVLRRIALPKNSKTRSPKELAEKRAKKSLDFITEILKELAKDGKRESLAGYFGLKNISSLLYDKKITGQHVVNALILFLNCKDSDELIAKLITFMDDFSLKNPSRKSDIEWKALDKVLDEDEKMYLIYCGKKYKQMKDKRALIKR